MSERGKAFGQVKLSELAHCWGETGEGDQGDIYPGQFSTENLKSQAWVFGLCPLGKSFQVSE